MFPYSRPQVTLNILSNPTYLAVRDVIFEVLEPRPQLRTEISRRLRLLVADNEAS